MAKQFGNDPNVASATNGIWIVKKNGSQGDQLANFSFVVTSVISSDLPDWGGFGLRVFFQARGSQEPATRPDEPASVDICIFEKEMKSDNVLQSTLRNKLKSNTVQCRY